MGFIFSGHSAPLSAQVADALDPAKLPRSWSAEVTIHHAFHAPADVVSLGVLLLRLLLANDRQEPARVTRDAADRVVRFITRGAADETSAPGSTAGLARERLHAAFGKEGIASAAAEVLHRAVDRAAPSAASAIPSALWDDALLVALRMASNVRGWSVCARQDDYPAADPAQPMRAALDEIEALIDRARGELIGSSGRNADVIAVCDDFLADLAEAAAAAGAAPSAKGSRGEPRDETIGVRGRRR
jgi:hypothetical protein